MSTKMKSNGAPERDPLGRCFVNLLEDAGFKAVLADKSNKSVLIGMLNHILPNYARVSDIVKYRDREQNPDYFGAKKTVLDLACEGEDGSTFDIEVQQADSPFMFERIAFYAAGGYHSQLARNSSYETLRPSYSIVILKGKLWHEMVDLSRYQPVTLAKRGDRIELQKEDLLPDKVVTRYMFIEEESKIFAPSTIFCIFAQLGRFNKSLEECGSELDYMLYWFKHSSERETLPEKFAGIPFLDDLGEATRVAGFSKDKYKLYQADMKSERDIMFFTRERELEASEKAMKQGREEGRAEGLAEGMAKGRSEGLEQGHSKGLEEGIAKGRAEGLEDARRFIAAEMKSMGLPYEQISKATGLDLAAIDSI